VTTRSSSTPVGVTDATWLDKAGHPHSVDAKIEERYTRVDHNHLQMVVTVDDPKVFTKPFVLSKNDYRWIRIRKRKSRCACRRK
jgi:hypothetical protein